MFEKINPKLDTKLKNYMNSRFGFPKDYFDKYEFYKNKKKIFIISNQDNNITNNINKIIEKTNIKSLGLELFVNYKKYLLSSLSLGLLDANLVKLNYVELDRSQTKDYFKEKIINLNKIAKNKKNILSFGQIIGIYNKRIIGIFDYKIKNKIKPNIVIKNEDIR